MIIRGLFAEIIDRLVARGAAIQPRDVPPGQSFTSYITVGHNHTAPFDAEVLKVVLDEMCEEAGVQVLFHSSFISPIMEGNAVRGLVIATKAGLRAVSAQMVIDCTGDADVAFRSGVLAADVGLDADAVAGKTKWYFWPNAQIREFIALLSRSWKLHLLLSLLLVIASLLLSYMGAVVEHLIR